MESWEDVADAEATKQPDAAKATPALKASSMSWNPNASAAAWVPGGGFGGGGASVLAAAAAPTAAPAPDAVAPVSPKPASAPTPAAVPTPAPAPVVEAAPAEAPAKEDVGEDAGEASPAVTEAEIKELQSLLAAGEISQEDFDDAMGGGGAEDDGGEEDTKEDVKEEEVDEILPSASALAEAGDPREHMNVVFIGHVDAGKSTLSGQILFLTEQVDKRMIEKFEKEAKDRNRESWFMAYIMDTNEEERAKGKTVEVGMAHFETVDKRFTILDAPGHKNYVPNMIGGAAQADIAVLVISTRRGEFETGFEKGGQTREHAMLAKTLGVNKLVVVMNKMDDPTVQWEEKRFDECVTKLTPYLKSCGFNMQRNVSWLPISGLNGLNIKNRLPDDIAPWYKSRQTLLETLNDIEIKGRDSTAPLRMPILEKYSDRGAYIMGKIEAGTVRVGQKLTIMPNRAKVKVTEVQIKDECVASARPGENVRIKLNGLTEESVNKGFVLCDPNDTVKVVKRFEGQIVLMDLLEHRPLLTAGYNAVLHVHTAIEECSIESLISEVDRTTGKNSKRRPKYVRSGAQISAVIACKVSVCLEEFKVMRQLGRFTLRDEGRTIGIGTVTKILESTDA